MIAQTRAALFCLTLALAASLPATRGEDPPAGDTVYGSVEDAALAKKAPAAGLIVTKAEWDGLIKAWDIQKPFAVDFDKQMVVVGTNQGKTIKLTTEVDNANLVVRLVGSADIRPGFRYALKRVDRAGIKTVNGKPLPKE